MELFDFVRWVLILIVSVTIAFPLNVPMAAFAYKVHQAPAPIRMETASYWTRSTIAALGLAALSVVVLGIDYVLVSADVPAGIVHLALLLLYVPAATWFLSHMFALEDLLQGFNLFLIYVFLPGLLLAALYWMFNLRLPLALAESWLARSS